MDGGDVLVELANSAKYRFMWYRCPGIKKDKDSVFLLASQLANRLDALVVNMGWNSSFTNIHTALSPVRVRNHVSRFIIISFLFSICVSTYSQSKLNIVQSLEAAAK